MQQNWMGNDRVLLIINDIIERCAKPSNVGIMSVVLYGSRARGDRNSQNDYEFIILTDNGTDIGSFIKFNNIIRLELLKEKLFQVKILAYTPEVFEDILYNDTVVGTFLYMICKENIILFDKYGTFTAIKERLVRNDLKDEEVFLNQCVDFAKMLRSEKWERKWEKTLMQYKYMKQRRGFV